ncbi:MAG: hypothetical protein WBG50_15080 [Desulfomonilaceae bacterium]
MNNDNYTPGFAVEPTLLTEYLIEKAEEISHRNYRGFPLPFRGFGASVLAPFPELYEEFLTITSRSEDSVSERAKRCKEILIDATARPQDRESKDKGDEDEEKCEESSFDRAISTRLAWAARRDGEKMIERNDFRFLQIWMCMTFIALQGDAEKFQKFEALCLRYPDPEERIEQVTPILGEVVRSRMRRSQAASDQAS